MLKGPHWSCWLLFFSCQEQCLAYHSYSISICFLEAMIVNRQHHIMNGKSIKLVFRRFELASMEHCYKYLKLLESFCFLNKCLFILCLVCMLPYTTACMYCMSTLEDNLKELVFSFYPVSHGHPTQVFRLGAWCLYLLTHPAHSYLASLLLYLN